MFLHTWLRIRSQYVTCPAVIYDSADSLYRLIGDSINKRVICVTLREIGQNQIRTQDLANVLSSTLPTIERHVGIAVDY